MRSAQRQELIMTISKGQSCVMVELDILKDSLENMINSCEARFRETINNLKSEIFDLEHKTDIPEELKTLTNQYYIELENYTTQRYYSRNKLVIAIYSICEAILESICADYKLNVVKESEPRSKKCPHIDCKECDIKTRKKPNFYLNDYLYTINPKYKTECTDACIVSTSIRELRNYLTHSKENAKRASMVVEKLSQDGFSDIIQRNGKVIIDKIDTIQKILMYCYNMLVEAEHRAKDNYLKNQSLSK